MYTWIKRQWRENKGFVVFLLLMFVFRSAIADWNDVPTGSMKPTILEGDRIWVNKLAYDVSLPFTGISLYRHDHPQRGDIIVFDSEASNNRLVKRVIGVPGDTVSMHNNRVFLNGQPVEYAAAQSHGAFAEYIENLPNKPHAIRTGEGPAAITSFQAVTVPQGHYLALGDNRDNSADSRVIGFVPRDEIVGRANHVVLSLNYDNYYLPRPDRFFATL